MKYKVGDKVKIREDLVVEHKYGADTYVEDMEKYKGEITTVACVTDNNKYRLAVDTYWNWTDEMLENYIEEGNITMTVKDLLNKTDVEKGGFIISIYYPNAYFDATIGHNKINRNSELYKRFIKAYGDMIVDEVSFDIRNENMVVMLIKVDYCD